MDAVNVFVKSEKDTFGLLVPFGCKYVQLVEMLRTEMKIDNHDVVMGIEYVADADMSPMRITNDNSLMFYLELKRKDSRLTAYALNVKELCMSTNECHTTGGNAGQNSGSMMRTDEMRYSSVSVPTIDEFVSTLCLEYMDTDKEEMHDDIECVVTHPEVDCISKNQLFRDKKILKAAIALYAIKNHFEFRVYKSDKREYVLKCVGESCQWKLRASKVGKTDMFKVCYVQHGHSCAMNVVIRDHRQANSSLIGDFIKQKYTSTRTIYTPVDIMHDMATKYGLTVKYGKAWRAREHALEEVMGEPDSAYVKLPMFLNELERKNPRSKTAFEVGSEGNFKYAFMALGACIRGWRSCKPVVVIDATFLTGRYGGALFTACTQDANNGIFVLAFGIGDSENNESWSWFLQKFRDAYGERENMCFISDRHPAIEFSIRSVYPGVMHGFCAHHILQNLRTSYGYAKKNITRPFNAAARAYTKNDFNYHMNQLDQVNEGIRKDLEKIGFEKWSRSHSPINRFGAMTSNIVESVNSVTKSVKHCPVDYLFESLRFIVQGWFYKNRSNAQGMFTRLASKQENLLRNNVKHSMRLKVSPSTDYIFQVSDENTENLVDLRLRTCTCNRFQLDGLPCRHGLAVIGMKGEHPYSYCSHYHTKEAYIETYAGNIVPLGERDSWECIRSPLQSIILPPNSKRHPGRPKNSRRRTTVELYHATSCGRCGGKGHNRRTCNQPLPLILVRKRKREDVELPYE